MLLHEIQRNEALRKLDLAIMETTKEGKFYAKLNDNYRDEAAKLVQVQFSHSEKSLGTHVLRWCKCGLIEIPKYSKKSDSYFYSCPCWTPFSQKRKFAANDNASDEVDLHPSDFKYCDSFARLSKKQRQVLSI